MVTLFNVSFLNHYLPGATTVSDICQSTSEVYFEIEDTDSRELVIHNIAGLGVAKIQNPNMCSIEVLNYDKFLTSLSATFQTGKKRCDLILRNTNKEVFALGELKNSQSARCHRKKAKLQLYETLTAISNVVDIMNEYNSCNKRMACYFNKSNPAPKPLYATTAFGRLSFLFSNGIKMSFPKMEALGFDYFEFDGSQILTV